ncbi:MAG: tRNA pseudouridine(55) synthase TruB [Elusimicrobiota bacterium]|jgi:tRNA pseudouridine55 synthase
MNPPLDGLLLVDKPVGWTSHDVVAMVRGRLPKGHKVGHAGTLDPAATGLLMLLLGAYTRQASALLGLPKVYSGALRFGVETDTGDMEGRAVKELPPPSLDEESLRRIFASLTGEVELPVPAYSAVKHQGRPLYEYARKGQAVPVKSRSSLIESFELLAWRTPQADFRVRCSSGTYVRALACAVGTAAGSCAVLCALRRESIGPYSLGEARPVEPLRAMKAEDISLLLQPIRAA